MAREQTLHTANFMTKRPGVTNGICASACALIVTLKEEMEKYVNTAVT
jgi:hypothetical protein